MKKYLLFICLYTLLFSSCRKKKDDPTPPTNETIITSTIAGNLVSINAKTQAVNWKVLAGLILGYHQPCIYDNVVYVNRYYGYDTPNPTGIIGYDLKTGKEVYNLRLIIPQDSSKPNDTLSEQLRGIQDNIVVKDSYIFAITNRDLIAIDKVNKNVLWKWRPTPELIGLSRFIYETDQLYVNTGKHLYRIDPFTGKTSWKSIRYSEKPYFLNTPAIYKNLVFISSMGDDALLHAFDKETGILKWIKKDITNPTPIAIHNNTLFIGTKKGEFFALDPDNGAVKWVVNFPDASFYNTPCAAKGYVFISSDKTIYALDMNTGKIKWTYNAVYTPLPYNYRYFQSDLVAANDKVYLTADKLYVFNVQTGIPEVFSSPDQNYNFTSSPVLILDSNNKIHCSWGSEMMFQY